MFVRAPLTLRVPSDTLADIKEHVKQIEKAVSGKEPRFVLRALRALPSTSRRLNPNVLHKAVTGFYTANAAGKDFLLGFLEEVTHHTSVCSSRGSRRRRRGGGQCLLVEIGRASCRERV